MLFRLVENRKYYFLFSGLLILIGIATLVYSTVTTGAPLQLSIDFTGGTLFELQFEEGVGEQELRDFFEANSFEQLIVQELDPIESEDTETPSFPESSRWSVRTEEATSDDISLMLQSLNNNLAPVNQDATTTSEVSGSVGDEVSRAAVVATLFATVVIMGFIWMAFRKVPHPLRYGFAAITAMFHDILIVVTAMSIFGLLFNWQADALFLTALLTVLGFSVQDSIVMFDRVRENIIRRRGESYELIVNRSVMETIHRSLGTQLNGIFVMIALVLFGGETIRQFITIMLIGLASGTYSSIFIAVPLLVSWEKGEIPFISDDRSERNFASNPS